MQQNQLNPLWLFILAFMIAALAGVATVIRTVERITVRVVTTAILNSGALGLSIALILFTWCKDNTWFLLGLCLLAGLGGMTALGFVLMMVRVLVGRGGLDVHIDVSPKMKDPEVDNDPDKKQQP